MDFRRIPFQFTSTDPAKRQAELQKRFGLPVNKDKDKMHIDFANPGLMGMRPDGMSSASSSPRLQHRVPIFREGSPEPMKTSVDSSPVAGRKPHVRVVPIEIEGEDNLTRRHRNLSGPPVEDHLQKNGERTSWVPEEFASSPILRSFIPDQKPSAPRERTIPIKVEGVGQSKKAKTVPVKKEKPNIAKKEAGPKQNGCSPSKLHKAPEPKKPLTGTALSLKKIEGILEKLKIYHADVEKFTGTVKEKQYRYLDEMLTRLMLELDDIDTMGNEEVRLSRKAAVRKVQASVDLLEAKVTGEASQPMPEESSTKDQDVEMGVASSQEESAMSAPDEAKVTEGAAEPMPEEPTKDRDVEMEGASSQEESAVSEPDSQVKEDNASATVDQVEKTPDVEMESSAEDSQVLQETSSETSAVKESEESQVMEVDVDIKPSESEPVIEMTESSTEEPECSEQSNVVTDVTIEEVDSESCRESEKVLPTNEPVVSLPDSPMKELKSEIELNNATDSVVSTVNEEAQELKIDSDILSDTNDCVKELVTKSCHGDESGKNISNLENATSILNEHSKDIITETL